MSADNSSVFANAYAKLDSALVEHYKTGDYVPVGITLQDVAAEVLVALRFASAHVELMHASGFHSGRIIHGDSE